MTDTVWKYRLESMVNKLEMPVGAEILSVGEQHGVLVLWARVNPDLTLERRTFHIVGTGTNIPDVPVTHRGTVITAGGSLVLHVFEEGDAN